MSTHFLSVFRHNASYELEKLLPLAISNTADLKYILRVCQQYRIRGICSLFIKAETVKFVKDLHKSGQTFLNYLQHSGEEDKITSKAAPFFDSIASGDLACAREIARNSRVTWHENEEFEDDFLYILFLMKHFFLQGTQSECEAILQRFEEILEGEPDAHLDICKAFTSSDAKEFHIAFDDLIEKHESRFKKLVDSEMILPEEFATEGKLFVEGLALLRLAETKGFALEDDYLFMPSTAREKIVVIFSDNDWKNPIG